MKEFDLIKHYFAKQNLTRKDVTLGIGDDCAIVTPAKDHDIAITTDTLVEGVHFPESTSAKAIGHKSIAVNLSDLAAMGAEPSWISLAITLPNVDEQWVNDFCSAAFELCKIHNVKLIGGDTTQGPLSITVTAQGLVPRGEHVTRTGAQNNDFIYVTGNIGDAALFLLHYYGKVQLSDDVIPHVKKRLDFPTPRISAGKILRQYASAAIDLSDGLSADLAHICKGSAVGADIALDDLPLSDIMLNTLGSEASANLAFSGGDDYELLFCVPQQDRLAIENAMKKSGNKITCIGQINQSSKITTSFNNQTVSIINKGYEHFS